MARDWFEYVDKLAVPVALALVGVVYTASKDAADTKRAEAVRVENQKRLDLDRDAGYVKLLASPNERERDLGLKIIDALSSEHRFSRDLLPVVTAVAASGKPSDATVQTAAAIVAANPTPHAEAATPATTAAPIAVYIQIAREEQRDIARQLEERLRAAGFLTPGIEYVQGGTVNTYVRFFSPASAAAAARIAAGMTAFGFPTEVQNFVNARRPLASIEVWIGSKVAPNTIGVQVAG